MTARLSRLGLIAPLFLFLAVFFFWPLARMGVTAVSNPSALNAFPRFSEAVAGWDGEGLPPDPVQQAFVEDLRAQPGQDTIADAVRQLNSERSGFRSLIARTFPAVHDSTGPVDLAAVDARWGRPEFWQTIADNLSPYTDRFLLAALDLRHGSDGIEKVPAATAVHVPSLLRTMGMAAAVTVICALVGLPFAALMVASPPGWRAILLGLVLIPMWTSILVRCIAWFIILQNNGVLNQILMTLRLTGEPLALLFSRPGVLIAMTHVMLPFMVLSIYSVLLGVPKSLYPAAVSLGANPVRAFFHVTVPLSLRGVASGGLLVFLTSLGFYILPAILGGPTDQLVSSMVSFYAMGQANWSMASALGLILLTTTIGVNFIYQRLSSANMTGA